ncbi:MAG: 50S ribosomal protein L11 methyltransferase [Clostridiales bacterium]|nr:50S ribosomal protein L11 methyltransferase [Clostridiales bacterium]
MKWLKLTVLTTTLASDIVSQLLISEGSAGVMIEDKNDVALNQRPEGQWDIIDEEIARRIGDDVKVSGYYPEDERLKDTLANIKTRLSSLRSVAPDVDMGKLELRFDDIDEEDWAESWKKSYKPFRLGRHIVICPGWESYSPDTDDKVITIDPGMAFGTGTHETTRMCVALIEEYINPGMTALDIGTGTGILAMTAALMGAKSVLASDIDPMAAKVAAENVKINRLEDKITCACGDLFEKADVKADLISANIIADVIIFIAADAKKHLNDSGVFICSGIAREREDETIDSLRQAGFTSLDVRHEGEWTAIACR